MEGLSLPGAAAGAGALGGGALGGGRVPLGWRVSRTGSIWLEGPGKPQWCSRAGSRHCPSLPGWLGLVRVPPGAALSIMVISLISSYLLED